MADPICRWRNASVKQLCEFNQLLPLVDMEKANARRYVEERYFLWSEGKDFFKTPYQLACQMGLYYEDTTTFHVRFDRFLNIDESVAYLRGWGCCYYAPNPYSTSLKLDYVYEGRPIVINRFLVNWVLERGERTSWNEVRNALFPKGIGNDDILQNMINNYSEVHIVNGILKLKDKGSARKYSNIFVDVNPNDKKAFFDHFQTLFVKGDSSRNSNRSSLSPKIPSPSPSSLTPYLTAIRTKPFLLLAGISGTGKSRLVRKLAQATTTPELEGISAGELEAARFGLHKPANFELVQVKPNWHNSMDVVGYASNIPEPHYVFTPFVEFVAKAFLHEEVPFFLCLDEMNLAPVEEYFAEFLSAIESRSLAGGSYETDPIIKPFGTFGEDVCEAMLGHLLPGYSPKDVRLAGGKAGERVRELSERFRTRGLTLPKNLIVVGTVNMDETTFSFSRKVLDRAMSFEMNEVDYDAFVEGRTDDDLLRLAEGFGEGGLNELLVDRELDALEVLEALDEGDSAFVVGYLKRLNALLDGTPFKLGYRAANEALLYLAASKAFGVRSREAAMDEFTMMKVLSRLEGDEGKLRLSASGPDRARLSAAGIEPSEAEGFGSLSLLTALSALIGKALGGAPKAAGAAAEDRPAEEGEEGEPTESQPASSQSKKLRSLEKLKQMASALDRDNFVSYWT